MSSFNNGGKFFINFERVENHKNFYFCKLHLKIKIIVNFLVPKLFKYFKCLFKKRVKSFILNRESGK